MSVPADGMLASCANSHVPSYLVNYNKLIVIGLSVRHFIEVDYNWLVRASITGEYCVLRTEEVRVE